MEPALTLHDEPVWIRDLVDRRRRRMRRLDRMDRALTALFFAFLLAGALGFFAVLARGVEPVLHHDEATTHPAP